MYKLLIKKYYLIFINRNKFTGRSLKTQKIEHN